MEIFNREIEEILEMSGVTLNDLEGGKCITYINGEYHLEFPITDSDIEHLKGKLG